MYPTLGPDALGIRGSSITVGRDHSRPGRRVCGAGVRSADAAARDIDEQGLAAVQEQFAERRGEPALWNLPVAWRDETVAS